MSSFDKNKYEESKKKADTFFQKNKIIKSACFGEVRLNSDGFFHLINKNEKHKRDWKQQMKRFQLLPYVKTVLEGMKFYQEYLEILEDVKIKDHGVIKSARKCVRYWAFIAVIEDKIRVKVVLKKVGEGSVIFWSIIPYWDTTDYKGIKFATLDKGNLAED